MLINHLLLIFKFYIFSARNTKQLNFDNLKKTIKKIKKLEKQLTGSNKLKLLNKWCPIDHIIDWYSLQSKKGGWTGVMNFLSRFCFFFVFIFFGFSFFFFFFIFFFFFGFSFFSFFTLFVFL